MKKSVIKIRIYYEDTDCGNVVYYANYLRYMERGRTELLREQGLSFAQFHEQGFLFVATDASVKYRAPAYYNDLIDMETTVTDLTRVTVTFGTIFTNSKGTTLVTGEVKVACVNKNGKPQRMPREIVERLSSERLPCEAAR